MAPCWQTGLNAPFIDLDRCFLESAGDISNYTQHRGYEAYARQNVEVYRSMATAEGRVMALSSGFMTYAEAVKVETMRSPDKVVKEIVDALHAVPA